MIIPFIGQADAAAALRAAGTTPSPSSQNALIQGGLLPPTQLQAHLCNILPSAEGTGKDGLLEAISQILSYSVNTWDQGFLDKLYSSPTPVGIVAELLLASLNTNVHVYSVSPALTVIEKLVAHRLAGLFGLQGRHAGGVTVAGGSGSNLTSLVIARNTLFPETKTAGNAGRQFVVFTNEHGHYSVEKAAGIIGLGKDAVIRVPVDESGRMDASKLAALIRQSRDEGKTPLYVNATAGTTVLGSYDPFEEISAICKRENIWMHVDASWGGSVVFSVAQRAAKLKGVHLADSLTVNPHKMINVPVTCSFLLGPDMRVFHAANRIDAPYLFHGGDDDDDEQVWDLADLTLQCGRRGDALKLALSWVYYGPAGFERQVDHAFEMASLLVNEIQRRPSFTLVSENPPPCLQVCFYHQYSKVEQENTKRTVEMVKRLKRRGFMIDYASFHDSRIHEEGAFKGSFFRVVLNIQTRKETVFGLVTALEEVGQEVEA